MDPVDVIDFLKADRGLKSGKYVMRFASGLPAKVYLYSHPFAGEIEFGMRNPVDESERQLKSVKPIKTRNQ